MVGVEGVEKLGEDEYLLEIENPRRPHKAAGADAGAQLREDPVDLRDRHRGRWTGGGRALRRRKTASCLTAATFN